jgi:uncharacterized membrane-anchored protein YhcB (DUF1043 family)
VGFEVWIVIVLAASALSGWIGYAYARKDAPKQSELDEMAAELEAARVQAQSVEANVNEHFEQSAMLFGKLAADYREFLDHFSASAQNLGLSEARARELIEQGFQPLLTHEEDTASIVADAVPETATEAATEASAESSVEDVAPVPEDPGGETLKDEEPPSAEEPEALRASDVTVELPDAAVADEADSTESERKQAG